MTTSSISARWETEYIHVCKSHTNGSCKTSESGVHNKKNKTWTRIIMTKCIPLTELLEGVAIGFF